MAHELDIKIELGNSAFDGGNAGPECARILRKLADRLENGHFSTFDYCAGPLKDYNGNNVGYAVT